MRKFLTLLVAFLFVAFIQATAYPIAPQTLRKLILNSDFIVVGKVNNPNKCWEQKTFSKLTNDTIVEKICLINGEGRAHLKILESLKGTLQDSIYVEYEHRMSNPRPPRYQHESVVIAFLLKSDTSDAYHTVGLSYGTKIIESDDELNVYEERIREFQEIQKIRRKNKRKEAIVDWLVKCLESKYTKWDGAYDLYRKGHWTSKYDYTKDEEFYKFLTKDQLSRIDSIFFSKKVMSAVEMTLSYLISKEKYSQLKEHLLDNLVKAHYHHAEEIMKRYIELSPSEDLQKIFEQVEEISIFGDEDIDSVKVNSLVVEFINIAKVSQ